MITNLPQSITQSNMSTSKTGLVKSSMTSRTTIATEELQTIPLQMNHVQSRVRDPPTLFLKVISETISLTTISMCS